MKSTSSDSQTSDSAGAPRCSLVRTLLGLRGHAPANRVSFDQLVQAALADAEADMRAELAEPESDNPLDASASPPLAGPDPAPSRAEGKTRLTVAAHAAGNETLRRRLKARIEFPAAFLERLIVVTGVALDGVLDRAGLTADTELAERLVEESCVALAERLRQRDGNRRPADILLDLVERRMLPFDEAVAELADAGAVIGVSRLVAARLGVSAEHIVRAVNAPSDHVIGQMCRAAHLGINGYSAILRLRHRRMPDVPQNPADALIAYQQLSPELAQQSVQILKRRETV
jgi:hypothetical protein